VPGSLVGIIGILEGTVVMVQDCSTSRLAHTLSTRRLLARQAVALGVFWSACAVARLSPFHEPEPITGILIVTGMFALWIVLAWGWKKRDDAISIADDLILLGYGGERRRTPVDCALADRIAAIESPRARHRLAVDLRWRLQLAAGTTRPSPGYVRACAFPPLGSVGRRVFMEEQLRIAHAADRIEESRVDPRALVLLWRIVTTPPVPYLSGARPAPADTSAEELREAVRRACRLAEGSRFR
jgi:hypothetical protein